MPRRNDGTFQRQGLDGRVGRTIFLQQQNTGVRPRPEFFDQALNDVADALQDSVSRTGKGAAQANLPMGGHKHTGVADAVNSDEYATYGQLLERSFLFVEPTNVGSDVNSIVLNVPEGTVLAQGLKIGFVAKGANTQSNVQIIIDSNTINIKLSSGRKLNIGAFQTNQLVEIEYIGNDFRVVSELSYPIITLPFATSLTWDVLERPNAGITLTDDVDSFTISNAIDGGVYSLLIVQDATGNRDFPFPSALVWNRNSPERISSPANARSLFTFKRVGSLFITAPMLHS